MVNIAAIRIISKIKMRLASSLGQRVISAPSNRFTFKMFLRTRKMLHATNTANARNSNIFNARV